MNRVVALALFEARLLGMRANLVYAAALALVAVAWLGGASLVAWQLQKHVETTVRIEVEDAALRSSFEAGSPANVHVGPPTKRPREQGQVLVQIPAGVLEHGGFTVQGDTVSVKPIRAAVSAALLEALVDHRLGVAPTITVHAPPPAPPQTPGTVSLIAVLFFVSLVSGLSQGERLGKSSAVRHTTLLSLASSRRHAVVGRILGGLVWELAGRSLFLFVAAVVWVFSERNGALLLRCMAVSILIFLQVFSVVAIGSRAGMFEDRSRGLVRGGITLVGLGLSVFALLHPLGGWLPLVGLMPSGYAAAIGSPEWSLAMQLPWTVAGLALAVWVLGRAESPVQYLLRMRR